MEAIANPVESVPQRSAWELVIDHVEGRRAALPADVVDLVIDDMRAHDDLTRRYGIPGSDHLFDAYQAALDVAARLTAELADQALSPDTLIDVRLPNSARLVRVQSMLWDHVRTIVQLRGLIEERAS